MRDLSQINRVTQVATDNTLDLTQVAGTAANAIQTNIRQNEEAKITQGVSEAQLELAQLENKIKIDYEGDPQGGFEELKLQRQQIFNNIGERVSPAYRRQWQQRAAELGNRNNLTAQAWVFNQTRANTVNSVNSTIANNIQQAALDGRAFGASDAKNVEAALNFGTSLESLRAYTEGNLSESEANGLLGDFEEDYLKSFVSGIAESDPQKALEALDTEGVHSRFADGEQFTKFRRSVEARVIRQQRAQVATRKADQKLRVNALARQGRAQDYAKLQQQLNEVDASPAERAFFEDLNGFANAKAALSTEQKTDLKNKFNQLTTNFIRNNEVTQKDVDLYQDGVYDAITKGVLTKTEGFSLLNQLVNPLAEAQKERASEFQTGHWNPFYDNLGLDTVAEEFNKFTGNVAGEGRRKPTPQQEFIVKSNQNKFLDSYMQNLESAAAARNTTISGLSSLPSKEGTKIYNEAITEAKRSLNRELFGTDEYNGVVRPVQPVIDKGALQVDADTGQRYRYKGGPRNVESSWELVE